MRCWTLAAVFLAGVVGSCDGSNDDGPNDADPYAGLTQGLSPGDINCTDDGERCCFYRCGYNPDQSVLCVSRDSAHLAQAFSYSCDGIALPEWFYNHDCYVLTDEGYWTSSVTLMFVQCFCGRTSTTYASEWSSTVQLTDNGCDAALSAVEPPSEDLFTCDNPCDDCVARCTGRQCGADGCGGTCAPGCSASEICNAAGQCVTESSGTTCSECIAACSGLPHCCTGCGCICEDACGMCW